MPTGLKKSFWKEELDKSVYIKELYCLKNICPRNYLMEKQPNQLILKFLILGIITGIIVIWVFIGKLIDKHKAQWRKILCSANIKHTFRKSNAGISKKFISLEMSYSKCVYCSRFKVNHQLPVPNSYIRELLKQKSIYELTAYKKFVIIEKINWPTIC